MAATPGSDVALGTRDADGDEGGCIGLDDTLLLRLAAGGSEPAWRELFRRKQHIVRHAGRSVGLSLADVDDVAQATWLALLVNIHRLRQPQSINGWLAVTARREAIRVSKLQGRLVELNEETVEPREDPNVNLSPEGSTIAEERRVVLRRAVSGLPAQQCRLVELLLQNEGPRYSHVANAAGMAIGSIGPTRRRALNQLSRKKAVVALRG